MMIDPRGPVGCKCSPLCPMSTIITGPRVTNEGYGESIGLERWKEWGNFESECEARPQVPQLAPPIIDFCRF